LKIIKSLKEKPVYNGTSKVTGKPYQIYEAWCEVERDGKTSECAVKAFTDIIKAGADLQETNHELKSRDDGRTYDVITVKATGAPAGRPGWKSDKIIRTYEEMSRLCKWAAEQTDAVLRRGDVSVDRLDPQWSNVFDRILSNSTVCVKPEDK